MRFKDYSTDNPPKRGTAKKIYQAFIECGFTVHNLHYNANCWMHNLNDGWATWACGISDATGWWIECFCGWDNERGAYLQGSSAPFHVIWLQSPQQEQEENDE